MTLYFDWNILSVSEILTDEILLCSVSSSLRGSKGLAPSLALPTYFNMSEANTSNKPPLGSEEGVGGVEVGSGR